VPPLRVAGAVVPEPLEVLRHYAAKHSETLLRYDRPGPGDPVVLTAAEVARTRLVRSRISNEEARDWFLARAEDAPWADVPVDATLADADPGVHGGLYDAAQALYLHFRARRGVATAKVSKVLHVKRPALYPILDSRLMRSYRTAAREAAARYPDRGATHLYWAAVRDDVIDPRNVASLAAIREQLSAEGSPLAGLSDLRLLDIATWSPSPSSRR